MLPLYRFACVLPLSYVLALHCGALNTYGALNTVFSLYNVVQTSLYVVVHMVFGVLGKVQRGLPKFSGWAGQGRRSVQSFQTSSRSALHGGLLTRRGWRVSPSLIGITLMRKVTTDPYQESHQSMRKVTTGFVRGRLTYVSLEAGPHRLSRYREPLGNKLPAKTPGFPPPEVGRDSAE